MTRPFESELELLPIHLPATALTEAEVMGLLRQAAGGLARLEETPRCPGMSSHLSAASHAVHRALVELESIS